MVDPSKTEIPELPAELRRAAKISTSGYWAGVFLTAADEIEHLRGNKQQQSETNEPVGAQISGGRCWHCHNQIMVAPELGCPTCGREQDLRVLYFGQPPKVT